MKQTPERPLVYCGTGVPLYREDPQGRGIWFWCRGHHEEHLKRWAELNIPPEELQRLLAEKGKARG